METSCRQDAKILDDKRFLMFITKQLSAVILSCFFISSSSQIPNYCYDQKIGIDISNFRSYKTDFDKSQIKCLTDNIYFEARGQNKQGQIAVTQVVLNRVKDSRFPNTACKVVKQKKGRICQFSWVCSPNKKIKDSKSYNEAYTVAKFVYENRFILSDITKGAKFYHASYLKPGWFSKMQRSNVIGDHIFYKG